MTKQQIVTIEQADAKYDTEVDKWLALCEHTYDGYSSHSIDAIVAARASLQAACAPLGVRVPEAVEVRAAMRGKVA